MIVYDVTHSANREGIWKSTLILKHAKDHPTSVKETELPVNYKPSMMDILVQRINKYWKVYLTRFGSIKVAGSRSVY